MIRLISCFSKRDDISIQDFRKFWDGPEFNALIKGVAQISKANAYAKNSTLQVDMNKVIAELRHTKKPFDGTIEYWWDKASDFQTVSSNHEFADATRKLTLFQQDFIDLSQSHSFFTENQVESL